MSDPQAGTREYYLSQLRKSKGAASNSLQNQAQQAINYQALQELNASAVTSPEPITITKESISNKAQEILDRDYLVRRTPATQILGPNSNAPITVSPEISEYAVPVVDKQVRDDNIRAAYSQYQQANLGIQKSAFEADRSNKIRQNYETFKAKQSESAGGGATAYGERLPVEYRVDLDDSLSGIIPGKMHYSVDLQDRLGGNGSGKKKADTSIGGQLRNVGGYLGEQTSEAIDLLALGSANKRQASKASENVKQFTGYDEANPPISPIKAGIAGGKVLYDRLFGKDESGDLAEFNRNLSGAGERPIEFGANTGVDVMELLVGSKGSKSAAKTAIGLSDLGKGTKGSKDVAGITFLDDSTKLSWLPRAEAAKGGDVARSSFEAKPAVFKRETIDLGSGIGKVPESKPFETVTTIDLGKGTGKVPKKFKNTTVDLGRGVGEFVDLGKSEGSISDIGKDFGGTAGKPRPKPKPSEADNGNGTSLLMEEPVQTSTVAEATQSTEQVTQSETAQQIYAELNAAQTVDPDALQVGASSLGIGNSTVVVTERLAKKNKPPKGDFSQLHKMQEVAKTTGKQRSALLTQMRQQGKRAQSGKERQELLLDRQLGYQMLENLANKTTQKQRQGLKGVSVEVAQQKPKQAARQVPKLDNILDFQQIPAQSQRTVSRTVPKQSNITIPKFDIPTRTTPSYDIPLIPKFKPVPPGPKPVKVDIPKTPKSSSSIDLKLPGGPAKLDFGGKRKAGKDAVDKLGVSNILFPALDIKVAHPSKGTLKRHGSGGMFGGTQDVPFSFDVGKNALFGPPPRKGKSRKAKKNQFGGLL